MLEQEALAVVLRHCREQYPLEACGWLGGELLLAQEGGQRVPVGGRAREAYPMTNVAPDKQRRYAMDPREQFAVLRTLRERGQDLVAIYHSHPATPPLPSPTDVELAYTKDAYYLIVSLAGPEPEWRAWLLDCDTRKVQEVSVVVVDSGR